MGLELVSPTSLTTLEIFNVIHAKKASQVAHGEESACNTGNTGVVNLIPGSGRSHGGGHGNTLKYSCLENPMNIGA